MGITIEYEEMKAILEQHFKVKISYWFPHDVDDVTIIEIEQ